MIEILKAEFDLLWKKVEHEDCEREFIEYLETYDLIDMDKARDQAREGRL